MSGVNASRQGVPSDSGHAIRRHSDSIRVRDPGRKLVSASLAACRLFDSPSDQPGGRSLAWGPPRNDCDDVPRQTIEITRPQVVDALQALSRALEQTADSVLITDNDGVIEYVNPAFETMTGFSRQTVIGRKPSILRSGAHTNDFYEKLWRTILSGGTFRAIMTNRRPNGTLYYEDQTITPITNDAGQIVHFVSTGRDITQRRHTQEVLRRLNQQLECEAGRIGGILHDEAGQFLTSAHLQLAEVCAEVTPEVCAKLLAVRGQLDRIEERLRRVSHEVHPRIVEDLGLSAAVASCVEGFSRRLSIPVNLESKLERRYSLLVETLFYRLVQEGLTNIIRHARATRVTIRLCGDEHTVSCSVEDDGEGFDPESLAGRTAGLGLRLMQDRLEAVGGSLAIISAPGRGTKLAASVMVDS